MNIPDHLLYSKDHEWVFLKGEEATVGITDFAQSELGDIIFLEFPRKGASFRQGEAFGTIEAVKTVSDLFLLPSERESFGLAALEAMACQVPVVASRVGGLPEIIDHGVTGFLHPPDDIDAMAASAVAMLTDPASHRVVSEAALAAVLQRFCANEIVPRYEAFYQEVIDREPVPGLATSPLAHR